MKTVWKRNKYKVSCLRVTSHVTYKEMQVSWKTPLLLLILYVIFLSVPVFSNKKIMENIFVNHK